MNLKAVKAKKEILDKFQNLSLIMQIDNNDKRLVEEYSKLATELTELRHKRMFCKIKPLRRSSKDNI